ncbi:MAG: putative Glycosyl transferase group 1 [Acidimicrobiales bacterium]|nr:putative Glycosyl transferase group 1 [Acidimicrobiales bacterium]
MKLRHRILFDIQATQSQAHADRGVARYVKDQVRALRRLGVGDALLLNPNLPFPRNLDQDLLSAPDLRWATQSEIRRLVEADHRPVAFYLTSPFELSQWPEGDLPPQLLRGDVPVVGTLYDLIPLLFPDRYLTDPALASRYRGRVEQLHQLDKILTISEHTRRDALDLLGLDPAKVVTIGFGVSPYFHPLEPGDDPDVAIARHTPEVRRPFVLTVLGGDPRKNAERLFEAWAEARRAAGVPHQLVVTCSLDPDTQARWEQAAKANGLTPGDDIVLTNWQPDHVLRGLYQRCDLFVFPALYEGAGLPPAEAIACGAPTITSSTSSLPEVLDWPDSTFDPESVDAMAALMARGLTDEAFRDELRARGRDRSASLTWDAVARRTVDALADLPEPAGGRTRLPVRIALVGPTPPTPSGIADYNDRLIPALAARCELDVFTPGPGHTHEHPNLRWFPPRALRGPCSPWSYDAVVFTAGNSDDHHELYNLAEEFPGILWLHDVRLPGLYLTYARDQLPEKNREEFLRSRLLRQYRRRLPFHVLDVVDRTPSHYVELGLGMTKEFVDVARGVIVSSSLAERLVTLDRQPDLGMPPTWVLPLAAPPAWGDDTQRVRADRPSIVSLGMVSPVKGTELLVSAVAALRRSGVDAHLTFVGPVDDDYRAHLERHVAAAGASGHVTITGHVGEADYLDWIARATVAVQLRVSTNGESSAAVTDALAGGLPVVTNVHAASELPAGTVDLVPWDVDATGLADHLRSLLDDPDRLRALAEGGHSFARSWGFEQVADRLLEIVAQL